MLVTTRPLIPTLVALGIARYCGFSLIDWVSAVLAVLYTAVAAPLTAVWKLLYPAADSPQQYLPDLHQAILNVTRDAARVADLLEEFFAQQYRDDPTLKDKFMAYMSAQANTSYSLVDNQLSLILWLYSLLWMPLLAVLCFVRASRSARHCQTEDTTTPAGGGVQSMSAQHQSSNNFLAAIQPQLPSADAPHQRALLRPATRVAAPHRTDLSDQAQQLRASSDQYVPPQQKLASSASMPAHGLQVSSSFKSGRFPCALESDVQLADQFSNERGSAEPSMRSARSVVVCHEQGAAAAAEPVYNWKMS